MKRQIFFSTAIFGIGIFVGGAFSQTKPQLNVGTTKHSAKHSSSQAVSAEGISHADYAQLVKRVRVVERRLRTLEAARTSAKALEIEPIKRIVTPTEDKVQPSEARIRNVVAEALRTGDSPLRAEFAQVVQDEFANMRSEWSAYRKARQEMRDEDFIAELANAIEISERERQQLESLLTTERQKIGEIRKAARETFDIRGARVQRREVSRQTDAAAFELLGAEGFEAWKDLRQKKQERRRR